MKKQNLNRNIFGRKETWELKLIEFVPCVGNASIRKSQRSVFSFVNFLLFQLTFLFDCLHDFFLQGLFFSLSCCWWSNRLSESDFVNCVGFVMMREFQNAITIDKCLHSKSSFSKYTGLIISKNVVINLLVRSDEKDKNSFLALESQRTRIDRIVCNMGSI